MPPLEPECIPPKNDANIRLDQAAELARRVRRVPAGSLAPPGSPGAPPAPSGSGKSRLPIDIATAAVHIIIAGSPGSIIEIWELKLWNKVAQDITITDSNDVDPLDPQMEAFPASAGYYLPSQGEPHFELKDGGSFCITLSAATRVTGFVRYRMRSA
jgi:hypothetical protein